jgi:hypothetical protein
MSSPGHISITALAVLECPRAVDPQKGNRHVVFDATFNINQDTGDATVGLLRYFASDEMAVRVFKIREKEYQKAFVVANVSVFFLLKESLNRFPFACSLTTDSSSYSEEHSTLCHYTRP